MPSIFTGGIAFHGGHLYRAGRTGSWNAACDRLDPKPRLTQSISAEPIWPALMDAGHRGPRASHAFRFSKG